MILHTVAFRLKHPSGSSEESAFLEAARALEKIPSVGRFDQYRQVSAKNSFTFGLSFEFADDKAYVAYNDHPDHVAFVRDRWLPEVAEFMEIDYVPFPQTVTPAQAGAPLNRQ